MTQMRKRQVLTRKLSALEALGGITNICSDKTGTLTQGLMTVRKAWVPGVGIVSVSNSEDPSNPKQGQITVGPAKSKAELEAEKEAREEHFDTQRSGAALKFDLPPKPHKSEKDTAKSGTFEEKLPEGTEDFSEMTTELEALVRTAALCNLATVRHNEQENKWQTTGDPTEVALQVFAYRFDKGKKTLEKNDGWNQIYEYPFDSTVKRMSVVYQTPGTRDIQIFTKGAVERVLDLCDDVGIGGVRERMTDATKDAIYEQMSLLADQGLRVLALAAKSWPGEFVEDTPRDQVESNLTLLGLTGLYDPPRLETKDAVRGKTSGTNFYLFY
jgi:P-type Na+/K+ transporter